MEPLKFRTCSSAFSNSSWMLIIIIIIISASSSSESDDAMNSLNMNSPRSSSPLPSFHDESIDDLEVMTERIKTGSDISSNTHSVRWKSEHYTNFDWWNKKPEEKPQKKKKAKEKPVVESNNNTPDKTRKLDRLTTPTRGSHLDYLPYVGGRGAIPYWRQTKFEET